MPEPIVVQGVGKRFRRYHPDRPRTLKEAFVRGLRWVKPVDYFWALREVSFGVGSGCMLGIIGHNGAGKSTLLRLVGGVGRPDEGSVQTRGRISALLELGAGFHPELTGRENIFISGVLAGLTRREIAHRFDSMVAFAELEQFIDSPLRTYSTGMQTRLAFAVAVHTTPDILLIDEVLAVGDLWFQRKCLQQIAQFKAEGAAIIFISHDTAQVQQLCDQVLWLRNGRIAGHGDPAEVIRRYIDDKSAELRRRTPTEWPILQTRMGTELRVQENRFGSLEAEITDVRLLNSIGVPVTAIASGEPLHVEIDYAFPRPVCSPVFSVIISREDNVNCCNINTADGLALPLVDGRGQITLYLERLDLVGGRYYVDVGVYAPNWTYPYDYHWHVYPLLIHPTGNDQGFVRPPHRWRPSKSWGQSIRLA
jgi:lipopolysaccharide transport system ATP-binding protein